MAPFTLLGTAINEKWGKGGVDGGAIEVTMPQHFLDVTQAGAALQQVTGTGMTQELKAKGHPYTYCIVVKCRLRS